jgi:hypothetical protein
MSKPQVVLGKQYAVRNPILPKASNFPVGTIGYTGWRYSIRKVVDVKEGGVKYWKVAREPALASRGQLAKMGDIQFATPGQIRRAGVLQSYIDSGASVKGLKALAYYCWGVTTLGHRSLKAEQLNSLLSYRRDTFERHNREGFLGCHIIWTNVKYLLRVSNRLQSESDNRVYNYYFQKGKRVATISESQPDRYIYIDWRMFHEMLRTQMPFYNEVGLAQLGKYNFNKVYWHPDDEEDRIEEMEEAGYLVEED